MVTRIDSRIKMYEEKKTYYSIDWSNYIIVHTQWFSRVLYTVQVGHLVGYGVFYINIVKNIKHTVHCWMVHSYYSEPNIYMDVIVCTIVRVNHFFFILYLNSQETILRKKRVISSLARIHRIKIRIRSFRGLNHQDGHVGFAVKRLSRFESFLSVLFGGLIPFGSFKSSTRGTLLKHSSQLAARRIFQYVNGTSSPSNFIFKNKLITRRYIVRKDLLWNSPLETWIPNWFLLIVRWWYPRETLCSCLRNVFPMC